MDKVVRNVVSSVVAIVVITLVFGFGFPALMTGLLAARLRATRRTAA